jgi:hypothetical protein|tara:strand:- start:723 stop:902 length:180 start_codon:yes stop_codon:yes gene_type:complete
MKGQVRGLALELLRQDCVESLDNANAFPLAEEREEALVKARAVCKLYDTALHGAAKDDN